MVVCWNTDNSTSTAVEVHSIIITHTECTTVESSNVVGEKGFCQVSEPYFQIPLRAIDQYTFIHNNCHRYQISSVKVLICVYFLCAYCLLP
jgi:hypothetical protein